MDLAPGFPVKTKMYSRDIQGVKTDFLFSAYIDRLLLIITQLGAAGTIMTTTSDAAFEAQSPTYTTTVLSGKRDEPLLQLAARRIVENAASVGCMRPMIICMGFKDHAPQVMKEVVQAVSEDNIWS
mmetsp:Transcript_20290/g.51379  ORF Transcript_20290/g.51379 Transcript_20290/m.51379 type:complete len:126 (+) Transcript_20290:86-463(+)